MAEARIARSTWEKNEAADKLRQQGQGRWKFTVAGVLILAVVVYLIISGTVLGAAFFITVDEVVNNPEMVGETVRVSGAVLGDSITYDAETLTITFTVVHIPQKIDNLAEVLFDAVNNPSATRMQVVVENQVMPDLLQHEAQAILSGKLGEDGVFYATELLLKCPSRFEEAGPDQTISEFSHADF
jgi:cytochrome c-type biogenesis protein CcmE